MVKVEATTIKNKRQSRIISNARFSGAKINIAERYCANATTQILYPLITEKKLNILVRTNLDLRVSISFRLKVMGEGLRVVMLNFIFKPNPFCLISFAYFKNYKLLLIYSLLKILLLYLSLV